MEKGENTKDTDELFFNPLVERIKKAKNDDEIKDILDEVFVAGYNTGVDSEDDEDEEEEIVDVIDADEEDDEFPQEDDY